jgi:hypothetical protein
MATILSITRICGAARSTATTRAKIRNFLSHPTCLVSFSAPRPPAHYLSPRALQYSALDPNSQVLNQALFACCRRLYSSHNSDISSDGRASDTGSRRRGKRGGAGTSFDEGGSTIGGAFASLGAGRSSSAWSHASETESEDGGTRRERAVSDADNNWRSSGMDSDDSDWGRHRRISNESSDDYMGRKRFGKMELIGKRKPRSTPVSPSMGFLGTGSGASTSASAARRKAEQGLASPAASISSMASSLTTSPSMRPSTFGTAPNSSPYVQGSNISPAIRPYVAERPAVVKPSSSPASASPAAGTVAQKLSPVPAFPQHSDDDSSAAAGVTAEPTSNVLGVARFLPFPTVSLSLSLSLSLSFLLPFPPKLPRL